jgi:hypothetical protein
MFIHLLVSQITMRACCTLLLLALQCAMAQLAEPELSEPAATRWKQFATPYFSTNEKLLNLFYPAFENAGGVVVGVSFQQNLSLLVHARPEVSVIFDINPGLTEIVVPFFGKLLERCATRRQFISMLMGMDVTQQHTLQLLENPTDQIPATLGAIFEHASEPARKTRIEGLRAILRDEILPRLPPEATPAMRARALTWIDLLENQEILPGVFFHDATEAYSLSRDTAERHRLAGWLSTEDNYRTVRQYWMRGRIVCITGDISGGSVGKLAEWVRARNTQVTGIYLSNVGASVEGHFPMTWFRDMYAALAGLPLSPHAMALIAQGPWRLTAFAQPFTQAKWAHETLAQIPESYAIQLHEAPLEAGVQLGRAAVLPSLRQRLTQVDVKPGPYQALLQRIEAEPEAIQFFDIAQFGEWSVKAAPGVDTGSFTFRAIAVTLVEAGYLRHGL